MNRRPDMHRLHWLVIGLTCILSLSLLNGCGYRRAGVPPEPSLNISVAVPVFRNLTYRVAGEAIYTETLVQTLLRHGIRVQDVASAEYSLIGEVITYTNTGVAYSANDTAVLYKAEVELEITIKNRQQEVKLRERIRRRVEYPAQTQRAFQYNVDTAAMEDLAAQVAQTVLRRLFDLQSGEQPP